MPTLIACLEIRPSASGSHRLAAHTVIRLKKQYMQNESEEIRVEISLPADSRREPRPGDYATRVAGPRESSP